MTNEKTFSVSDIDLQKEGEIVKELFRIRSNTKYNFYCEQLAHLINSYTKNNYPRFSMTEYLIDKLIKDIRFHVLYAKLCETKLEMKEEDKQNKKWQFNFMNKFTTRD